MSESKEDSKVNDNESDEEDNEENDDNFVVVDSRQITNKTAVPDPEVNTMMESILRDFLISRPYLNSDCWTPEQHVSNNESSLRANGQKMSEDLYGLMGSESGDVRLVHDNSFEFREAFMHTNNLHMPLIEVFTAEQAAQLSSHPNWVKVDFHTLSRGTIMSDIITI